MINVGDSATQVKTRSEDLRNLAPATPPIITCFLSIQALPETLLTAFRRRLPTGVRKWPDRKEKLVNKHLILERQIRTIRQGCGAIDSITISGPTPE